MTSTAGFGKSGKAHIPVHMYVASDSLRSTVSIVFCTILQCSC